MNEPRGVWLTRHERDLFVGLLALHPRPRQVAFLICAGLSRRQIAERLFIEERTVRHHQHTIWRTCGLSIGASRIEFIRRMRALQRALADWETEMAEQSELEAA